MVREGDLLARFETAAGEQARFNLLRLMDLALAADQRGGSLRDFVHELEQADRLGGEDEGALPGESGTGRIRVMTVHGSKGLEAPVVILADAAVPLRDTTTDLLLAAGHADGPWLNGADRTLTDGIELAAGRTLPGLLAPARAQALAHLLEEESHVLYVALTRARDRLYVLGGRNDRQSADQGARSYLGWLDRADEDHGRWAPAADLIDRPPGQMEPSLAPEAAGERAARAVARLRVWTPPPLAPRMKLVSASQLDEERGGSASSIFSAEPPQSSNAAGDSAATLRGTRIHRWLERACTLGAMPAAAAADADLRQEWDEARAVFEADDLQWIFQPESHGGCGLSEVPIVQRLEDGPPERRLVGIIDRLIVRADRIDIVDYKSNRLEADDIDEKAQHYRAQMLAYLAAVAPLYPGRELHCWLLWTRLAAAGHPLALTEVIP